MNVLTTAIQTMTSREIAELTQKEHFHVMREIKAIFAELEIDESGYIQNWIHPQNGQTYQEYSLNKDLTTTLITGKGQVWLESKYNAENAI